MKPETRDRLLAAIDNAFARLTQFSTIESVTQWLWEFSGRVHRKMEHIRTREQITALLDAEPEPSASKLWALESVLQYAPFLLNRLVRKIATDAAKGLPGSPSGPKPVVDDSQKQAICQYIGDLYAAGVSLTNAQKRAAMRWNMSLRSIQRIWAERGSESKMSIEDAERTAREWWQSLD